MPKTKYMSTLQLVPVPNTSENPHDFVVLDNFAKTSRVGIQQSLHPHSFRHQMLTWLTKSGLTDAQIQLISGHSSKKSLEVYQHIGLESVEASYQAAASLAEASLNGRH
jgi:site-specific recombinase XerC